MVPTRVEAGQRPQADAVRALLDLAALDFPQAKKLTEKDNWDLSLIDEIQKTAMISPKVSRNFIQKFRLAEWLMLAIRNQSKKDYPFLPKIQFVPLLIFDQDLKWRRAGPPLVT